MARILIIEDDPAIRSSIEYALRRARYEVHSLATGTGAREAIEQFEPDVIILDLMLPGMSGLDIAKSIRRIDDETIIIMISALDQESDKITGLSIGADDYVSKPFSVDELLARIQANLRRVRTKNTTDEKRVLEIGDLVIDPQSRLVIVALEPITLRGKEFQLLYMLASRHGRELSRESLAQHVWGYEHMPHSRTIDVHIRRLRALIEDRSAYRYIHTIHGKGYRFCATKKEGTTP